MDNKINKDSSSNRFLNNLGSVIYEGEGYRFPVILKKYGVDILRFFAELQGHRYTYHDDGTVTVLKPSAVAPTCAGLPPGIYDLNLSMPPLDAPVYIYYYPSPGAGLEKIRAELLSNRGAPKWTIDVEVLVWSYIY